MGVDGISRGDFLEMIMAGGGLTKYDPSGTGISIKGIGVRRVDKDLVGR